MAKTQRPKPDFRGADLMNTSCSPLARSILDVIGRTPLVELTRSVESRGLSGRLLVKLEYFSPGGSKKDRIALEIIREAPGLGRAAPRADRRRADQRQHRHGSGGLETACRAGGRGHNRISRLRQRAQVLEHGSFPLSRARLQEKRLTSLSSVRQ